MNAAGRTAAVTAIVLAGVGLGFFSYRHLQRPGLRAAPAPVTAVPGGNDAGATAGDAADAPAPKHAAIPETLPDVKLHDVSGALKSLRSFGGRPLIVNFWASWCEPCRREIPLLHTLRTQYAPDHLEIVGVAIDTQSAVMDFLRTTKIDYPVLVGEEEGLAVVQSFGMEPVLPFSVFAEGRGAIVAVKIGELHRDEADYILGQLRALTAGTTTLPEARRGIAKRLQELALARTRAAAGATVPN
jgi:thiol-disulfide isomerase/thioredoxin